jgi:hypothetical protein
MKRANNLDADDPARRLRRDVATCERHIAWLEWLLGTKLDARHRALVDKELAGHREALIAYRTRLRGRGGITR